jgi:hypothetical protein
MDSLRHLTENINVFVRFFESINCLIFQVNWLESNLRNIQGPKVAIVLLILGFCGYYTFGCNSSTDGELCKDNVVGMGIISIMLVLILYFMWQCYQRRRMRMEEENSVPHAEVVEEEESFLSSKAVTPQAVLSEIEMGTLKGVPSRNSIIRY